MLLVGAVTALALTLAGGEDEQAEKPTEKPSPTASEKPASLPPGVQCTGQSCAGQDPETTGCGEDAATVSDAVLGTAYVEVRYSEVCGAAWGRLTNGVTGDAVRVSVGEQSESGAADASGSGYTPMVPADTAGRAQACLTLQSGQEGCTTPTG